jgi:hypothetical protein
VDDDEFDLFQLAWDLVDDAHRDMQTRRRRAGRWKRWTGCWWKHRTSWYDSVAQVRDCWACRKATL